MTIYTPNIIISKNYSFMNNFMEGRYFSELNVPEADDAIVFNKKQNRYVYSLEHSFNYGSADFYLTLKVVDVDGTFENQFFNETFYQRKMNVAVKKYIEDIKKPQDRAAKFSDFQLYVSDLLDSQIKIYLAYGIGDDLETWTDPIVCTLVAANIDAAANGVRNYTYKFIPEINNFFRPELEKNDNNPNEDFSYDFGAVSIETSYKITTPEVRDVRQNVYKLLKGFCAKATNTSEDNVIVVLPEFNSSINNSKSIVSKTRRASGRRGGGITTTTKTIGNINFNDKSEVEQFYSKIFNCIQSEYSESQITKTITTSKIARYVDKPGVMAQLQQDIAKLKTLENKVKNAEQAEQDDKEALKKIYKELSDRQAEKEKLIVAIGFKSSPVAPFPPDLEFVYYKDRTLKELQQSLDDLNSKIEDLNRKKNTTGNSQTSQTSIAKREVTKFKKDINFYKAFDLNSQIPLYEADITKSSFTKSEWHLTMRADGDITNDPNKIPFPNWRKAVNDVFKGIATIYNQGDSYIVPQVSFETSLRWLKFFKEVGLINDPTKPCLIVGDRQMVLDYIYCNQIPLTDIEKSQSNFSLDSKDPLWVAHNQYNYKSKVLDLANRKRNSSSFGEKLYLDELQLDRNNPLIKDTTLTLDDLSKKYDIPIFINNFKNSNVISYSLKNSENYIASLKYTVRSNRLKYLYTELLKDEEQIKDLFKAAGIDNPNPIALAEKLFKQTVALLPKEIDDIKFKQIEQEKLKLAIDGITDIQNQDKLNSLLNDKYSKFIAGALFEARSAKLSSQRNFPFNLTSSEIENRASIEKVPLVLTQSSQNVSYLNLALQKVLYDNFLDIKDSELAAISEFIILLNETKRINGGNSVTFIPGLTLPNKNFILAKLHEYDVAHSLNLTIKTLPFFNLTDSRTMNKPSIFYSKRVSIVGTDPVDVMDFFSGEYRIVGFRHVITTTECYSEFSLSKYLTNDEGIK